jgi:DNA-binding MarR family transcriptional regulator
MTAVKVPALPPLPEGGRSHLAALTGRLLEIVRQVLMSEDRDGLRNTHFRLLSCVPPAGATITELAGVLVMTKQAVGQFVTQLQASGHLEVTTDERDRRRRVVVRTDRGDRIVAEVEATIAALEQHWSDLVGPDRYRVFREVLADMALGHPGTGEGLPPHPVRGSG